MTPSTRRHFGGLRRQADEEDEAIRLRGLLSQPQAPADRHALIARIHDLVDRDPTSSNLRMLSSEQAVAPVSVKLLTVRYKEDSRRPHIEIDVQATCVLCEGKYCNFFCPAGVYRWDPAQKETLVSFGKTASSAAPVTSDVRTTTFVVIRPGAGTGCRAHSANRFHRPSHNLIRLAIRRRISYPRSHYLRAD